MRFTHSVFAPLFIALSVAPTQRAAVAQNVDPELLSALKARSIGPAGMSGRIAAVDVLASDPDVIWVGAATGGVWKSTNGGITFTPVFDDERVSGIGAVAIDPNAPDVVWVGTGEGNPRNSAGVGAGLYKTVDGGRTWTLLGLEKSERIHRVVIHPTDSDVVWVGVMGPAWSDGEERGVYKTTDGGRTWRRVLWVNERTGVSDLVLDPENPLELYAGMWEFRREPWFFTSGGPGSGLYVTRDGGETWSRYTESAGMPSGELGRIGLAVAPSDPDVVYALVEAERSALLRSADGGRSWQTVNADQGVADRPFYYADIFVDPENELRVYNLGSRIQISEDGGRSFQRMGSDVHSDFHAMWIDPENGRHILVGTDGGLWESRDRAATWRLFDNLPVGQFYHVSVDDAVPFNIYGGMQDNGSWRGPSDLWEVGGIRNYHWTEIAFGDGFNAMLDPRDESYGYAMSQGGNLQRFDLRNGERKSIRPWAPDGVDLRFNWNAPLAFDLFEVGTLYYGSQYVHKSPDRGHTWQIISPDLTTDDPDKQRQRESGGLTREASAAENHTSLLTIAPSPFEAELIWTGSDDGRVHIARAGGGTWEDVTDRIRGVPEATWIPHIEASKHAGSTAYVVFDDHRRGNWETYLYRTEDYGRRWENIGRETAIDGFLHTVEEDPLTPNLLFAGGELGLWVSLDRGESWFKWTHGLPTAPVRSLQIHPRDQDLVIGTHGRALWVLDDIRPLQALARDPSLVTAPLHLFQAPVAYLRQTVAVDGYHFSGDALFRGETRPAGALLTYWVAGPSADSVEISIRDADGAAVRSLRAPARPGLNRVTWDLRENAPAVPSEEGRGRSRSDAPEVLPGTYTVEARLGSAATETSVAVLPDPRVEVPMQERVEKYQAIRAAQDLDRRIRAARNLSRVIRDALERTVELMGDRSDDGFGELRETARAVGSALTAASSEEEVSRYRRGVRSLAGSYDRPTEGQKLDLDRLTVAVEELESALNRLLLSQVAELRRLVEAAGLGTFPDPGLLVR